jgi:hypothetical protein
MTFAYFWSVRKLNVESDKYQYINARDEKMEKLLEGINIEWLTADGVRRKIKMIKTVYSQKLNKIMKSKKSCAGTDDLYKTKLVWFEILM